MGLKIWKLHVSWVDGWQGAEITWKLVHSLGQCLDWQGWKTRTADWSTYCGCCVGFHFLVARLSEGSLTSNNVAQDSEYGVSVSANKQKLSPTLWSSFGSHIKFLPQYSAALSKSRNHTDSSEGEMVCPCWWASSKVLEEHMWDRRSCSHLWRMQSVIEALQSSE